MAPLTTGQLRAATSRLRERLAEFDRQLAAAGRVNVLKLIVTAPDPAAAFMRHTADGKGPVTGVVADFVTLPAGGSHKAFDPDSGQNRLEAASTSAGREPIAGRHGPRGCESNEVVPVGDAPERRPEILA